MSAKAGQPLSDPQQVQAGDRAGRIFLLLLAAYFVLQIVLRLNLSDALDLDEAEQAFLFQHLHAGYGAQPPLYTWLQWIMFSAFGVNLFALSVLKNLLLFTTYASMFMMARPLIGVAGAIAASASLFLLPAIGWESQRDLTHSVLLTTSACVTLCAYFYVLRKPTVWRYALFGLAVGLGAQSKYNFAIFIGGIVAASLLVEQHRAVLWNRKILIAIGIALLCLLPHAWWLLHHFGVATGGTLHKMGEGASAGYLSNVLQGSGSLFVAALSFLTPLWIIYGWLCRRHFRQAAIDRQNPQARFFLWLYAAFLAMLIMVVLSGHVTHIKSRWMLPFLFSVPLAFFVVWPALGQQAVFRAIPRVAVVFALIILLALPLRIYLGPMFDKVVRAHHPYPELSEQLARRFPQVHTLVVDAKLTAGNLYFQRPQLQVMLLGETLKNHPPLQGDVLLVTGGAEPSGDLQRFQAIYPNSSVQQQGRLDLQMDHGSTESMSFNFVHVLVRNP